jgi:hypothetical protein
MRLLQIIGSFLYAIRWLLIVAIGIGLPLYIYLAFIAKEPVFTVENDVELGKMSAQSLAEDPEEYPILPESEYPEAYDERLHQRQHPQRAHGPLLQPRSGRSIGRVLGSVPRDE